MARLGIFGGTFDPPHLGHLILASEARYQLSLDRLLWVLTPDSPLKQGHRKAPLEDRLAMVQAAISPDPGFQLSRVEIDRPGPHYALDTVRLIRASHPDANITYVMGGDSLKDLPDWYRPADFVAACDALGVLRRPGDEVELAALEDRIPGLQSRIRFIQAPLLEISSSELRRKIEAGEPVRYYLPREVEELIAARSLYR